MRMRNVCLFLAALGVTGTVWSVDRVQTHAYIDPAPTLRSHHARGRLCDIVDRRAAQTCVPAQPPRVCLLGAEKCTGAERPSLIPAGS
jgi:hypothetical protein